MIYDPDAITKGTEMFTKDISVLAKLRGEAEELLGRLQTEMQAKNAIRDQSNQAARASQERQAAEKTSLVKGLEAAIALVDGWYTRLVTPDTKGVVGLVNVAREKALSERIEGGNLLVIRVQKAGGGVMTKKNVWTLFGGMPPYHMEGAAVSFTLLEGKSGAVKSSGVVPVHGGFVKAGDVRKTVGS